MGKGRLRSVLLVVAFVVGALLPNPAVAQEPTPTAAPVSTEVTQVPATTPVSTAQVPTPAATPVSTGVTQAPAATPVSTPTATPVPRVVPPPPVADSPQLLWLVALTLAFALLALALLFGYAYRIQSLFYDVAARLGLSGRAVRAPMVDPLSRERASDEPAAGATAVLRIEGPAVVRLGVASAEFTASDANGRAATNADWRVEPSTAALVSPTTGARVEVIAAVAGTFKLIAKIPTPLAEGRVQVAAVAASQGAVELPFIGRGYGSIALAIVLVAAVIILGLAGILSGEGAATLLGSLLGYIFGATVASATRRGAGTSADD